MRIIRLLIILLISIVAVSSAVEKQVNYFQDLKPGQEIKKLQMSSEVVVQPGDKLYIRVSSRDEVLVKLFNLSEATTSSNKVIVGYTVSSLGTIDFPVLGSLSVLGKTKTQVSELIKSELVSKNFVKDPVVTVEFLNLGVSVFGEVKTPGRYPIERDRITILDVLSLAGDLTIQGRRDNIKVIRDEGSVHRVYSIDLTSGQGVYESPVFYLQQNDVVYVEPNSMKARQSTVNGNSVRNISFWMSLASLLTTIAVLVFK